MGSAAGGKFLAPPYFSQRAVFASPLGQAAIVLYFVFLPSLVLVSHFLGMSTSSETQLNLLSSSERHFLLKR